MAISLVDETPVSGVVSDKTFHLNVLQTAHSAYDPAVPVTYTFEIEAFILESSSSFKVSSVTLHVYDCQNTLKIVNSVLDLRYIVVPLNTDFEIPGVSTVVYN